MNYWQLPRRVVIVGAVILVVLGLLAGRGWAAVASDTRDGGAGASVLGGEDSRQAQQYGLASAPTLPPLEESVDAELDRRAEARAATEAALLELGWTPGTCEPVTPDVPLVGELPVCPQILPSVDHWLRIRNCEQPPGTGQGWATVGVFGNGMAGGGGLGLSNAAWFDWGGLAYAPYPGAASPWAQMVVASTGYARYGGSPWGCKA